MTSLKTVIVLVAVMASVALSGCSKFKSKSEVEALNEIQAVGSPFTQSLAAEYRALANVLQNNVMDYPDSLHFARKGLAAASGEVVVPEPISDWNLQPQHIEELAPARASLIAALDRGAREQSPQLAARAQARFDCWIEAQERRWDKQVTTCKNEFMDALNQLGPIVAAAPPPVSDVMPPVSAGATPSGPLAVEDAKYLVFFDFDSSRVDQGGQSVIDSVVAEINRQNISAVNIVGHTDTSGSNTYNERLGLRRANAVKKALEERGIQANIINAQTRGESQLMVPTPEGVREPANRRAEITFVK